MTEHEEFLSAVFGPCLKSQRVGRQKTIKESIKPLLENKEIVPTLFCLTDRVKNLGALGAVEVMARIGWQVMEEREFEKHWDGYQEEKIVG